MQAAFSPCLLYYYVCGYYTDVECPWQPLSKFFLQDSYGVPHGPVVTQGLHDHPVLHEVAPHDRSLHEKPLHPILNEVIPGHQESG